MLAARRFDEYAITVPELTAWRDAGTKSFKTQSLEYCRGVRFRREEVRPNFPTAERGRLVRCALDSVYRSCIDELKFLF